MIEQSLVWFFTFLLLSIHFCSFQFCIIEHSLSWFLLLYYWKCIFVVFLYSWEFILWFSLLHYWTFVVVVFSFFLLNIHCYGFYFCIIEHSLLWSLLLHYGIYILFGFYFCIIEHKLLSFLFLYYWTCIAVVFTLVLFNILSCGFYFDIFENVLL